VEPKSGLPAPALEIGQAKGGKRHILTSKTQDRKRRLSGTVLVDKTKTQALDRLLPYS
jgi:Ribosomal protein L35